MTALLQTRELDRIRHHNDTARQTFIGCFVDPTEAVRELDTDTKRRLMAEVRSYSAFAANDREHALGKIEMQGATFGWRMSYLDKTFTKAADDPADELKTRRVLRIWKIV